jgi:molybdopterin/thiamine biosynthesis adenylyltransferase
MHMRLAIDMSREEAAGYDVATLARAKILVVGAGALGQSLANVLALSQVGELLLVDFDDFEPSNASRSPFFPTEADRASWGTRKAAIVANKLRAQTSWSDCPRIQYACAHVQSLGDGAFRDASAVVSAVDEDGSREYLSTMCRRYSVPLVEGGFGGQHASYAVFQNAPGDPCWRCGVSEIVRSVRFSCDVYGKQAQTAGFIPATQSIAAALGGLMAEAVIQVLHGNPDVLNRRVYFNIRSGKSVVAELAANDDCPAVHSPLQPIPLHLTTPASAPARDVLDELATHVNEPCIELPNPFIVSAPCQQCQETLRVGKPIYLIGAQPRCRDHGGLWDREPGAQPLLITLLGGRTPDLLDSTCTSLGLAPATVFQVYDHDGSTRLFELPPTNDVFVKVQ